MEKLMVTVAEAAEMMNLSKPSVYDLCKRPDFPALRFGRKVLIPVDRLREWVNDHGGSEARAG